MKKIMFNDEYGLTNAVLQGRKTMTRRPVGNRMTDDDINAYFKGYTELANKCAYYKIGEVVAVAQSYKDLKYTKQWVEQHIKPNPNAKPTDPFEKKYPGWNNKMFVPAELNKAHQIQITNIKVERLQDISDEDCLKEGIYRWKDMEDCPKSLSEIQRNRFGYYGVWNAFSIPQKAFAALIERPGIGHKGDWNKNPWVLVYSFKLIK